MDIYVVVRDRQFTGSTDVAVIAFKTLKTAQECVDEMNKCGYARYAVDKIYLSND